MSSIAIDPVVPGEDDRGGLKRFREGVRLYSENLQHGPGKPLRDNRKEICLAYQQQGGRTVFPRIGLRGCAPRTGEGIDIAPLCFPVRLL